MSEPQELSPPARTPNRRPPTRYLPTWSRLKIASKQRTQFGRGGDFFEVCQHRDGSVSTFMADVAGNGLAAAVPVSDVRWLARQLLARGAGPAEVLAAANEWLVSQDLYTQFVTALCVRIEVGSGAARISSAGHLGPFLRRRSGATTSLTPPPALPLGILSGEAYGETSAHLDPDDVLVLVTDGITDRLSTADDPLGENGLVRSLARSARSITAICDALLGPDADRRVDHTVVALQMPPR